MSCLSCLKGDQGRKTNFQIEQNLKAEGRKAGSSVVLLLLGPSNSGKTTVLKQMKLYHGIDFSDAEKQHFRAHIITRIMDILSKKIKIVWKYIDGNPVSDDDPNAKDVNLFMEFWNNNKSEYTSILSSSDTVMQTSPLRLPTKQIAQAIVRLYTYMEAENKLKISFEDKALYSYKSFINYIVPKVPHVFKENYVPSNDDILHTRIITTRIRETRITVEKCTFKFVDVQGQNAVRQGWIKFFRDANCILFVADISSYATKSFETAGKTLMQDTLDLFESICYNMVLCRTSIIIFLNKIDIFKQIIETHPLKDYFPEFEKSEDMEENGNNEKWKNYARYIRKKFTSMANRNLGNNTEEKLRPIVVTHFTHGTDTKSMSVVIDAVEYIIVRKTMSKLL